MREEQWEGERDELVWRKRTYSVCYRGDWECRNWELRDRTETVAESETSVNGGGRGGATKQRLTLHWIERVVHSLPFLSFPLILAATSSLPVLSITVEHWRDNVWAWSHQKLLLSVYVCGSTLQSLFLSPPQKGNGQEMREVMQGMKRYFQKWTISCQYMSFTTSIER